MHTMTGDLFSAECEVEIYRKQLRASRAAFHAIVERSADGVLVLTQDGSIAYVNPAAEALFGRAAGELYGESLRIPLVPGEVSEIDVVQTDGKTRVAELRVAETEWQHRAAWIVTLRDVTEHKIAEKRIRDAVRRRDEFLALLSHELRNPLAAIRNAAAILFRADSVETGHVRSVEVIHRQCQQMARLLDDLLEVSRVSQGKILLQKETVDLRDVLAEAVESVAPQVETRRHELVVDIPKKPILLDGDAPRLTQIFSNLLTNACKYTEPGGRIELRCEGDAGTATIRIIDNGIGIASDLLAEIFEPFVQANTTLARSDTGLGLGLSLVRTLAEMHGGSVVGCSDGQGCGSEFTVRLPLLPDRAPCGKGGKLPFDEAIEPARIVLVEDNADVREMLKTLLDLDGHEVGAAPDGQAGLEMIEMSRPDIAIVDIGLPLLDGYEVAKRVRANPENDAIFLIALTGYGQADDRQRALESGYNAHLVKPVDLNRLNELLNRRTTELPEPATAGPCSTRLAYITPTGSIPPLRTLPPRST